MTKRRVYRIKPGSIANLKLIEEELDDPGENEIQIEVRCVGLNFADLYSVWGLYSATPSGPFIPGLEFSGIVRKVGVGSNLQPGDPVMGVTRFGGYCDRLNIAEDYLVPLPDNWTFQEGASYLVQVLTAYYALFELGNVSADDLVLIHSGAGGVGLLANQLAKQAGAATIGTTASVEKIKRMYEEGYDHALVRSKNFTNDLVEILAGRRLSIILECIGGKILKQGFDLMGPQGRMIVYGSAHFTGKGDRPNYFRLLWKYLNRPRIDPMELPTTNRSVMGFNLIYLYEKAELMHQMLQKISSMDLTKPSVGQTFNFELLPDALRALQSGKTVGKVIVAI